LEALLQTESLRGKQSRLITPNVDWNQIGETEHFVQFYEDDGYLVESVSRYVGQAITVGDGALIIATEAHRNRIHRKLKRRGLDLPTARSIGQYIALDAADLLSMFMVGDLPDPVKFEESIGGYLSKLSLGWPRVKAFGEMVAILWTEGKRQAATQVEVLWNDLARRHSFALFCAYPIEGFDDEEGPSLLDICDCHSRVIPAESYSSLTDSAEQLRTIADLQQKAHRLQAEIDQRKAADRDRALLAAIIESSDDAIISKTFDSIIRTWNKGAVRIFGYTESEAVGQSITLIIPPDRISEEDEILSRLRRGERIDNYETIRVAKDGRSLDVSLTISPVRDDEGNLIGASKIARDVTEQKRLYEALRDSEARYRQLAELLPVGVYVCNASGEITYFNRQATENWGRTPEIGDTDERFCGSLRLYLPDGTYLPHDQCPMAIALREGKEYRNVEVTIERPDGSRITALVNIDPIRDAGHRVIGAINVFHDLTALKRAEQSLREQKENLQTLLDTLPIAVFIAHDRDCQRISGNHAASQLLRLPPTANFSKSAPVEELPANFKVLREGKAVPPESLPMQRAARGEIVRGEEVDHEFDDRTVGHALVSAQPLLDAGGQPRGAIACMLDITDRKNAEIALKEADTRKDEFLATLAHELRNPLAPIRNGLQLLQMSSRNGDDEKDIQEMMDRQGSHLVRLVDDLLEVSRISRGKIELQKTRFALNTAIQLAIETSKAGIEASRQSLEVCLLDDSVIIDGDLVRLTQVFSNLLNNAAKFSDKDGGTITISAISESGKAVVSVRDTGIGIPKEMLFQVCEMFAQVDSPLGRSKDGLGIGLSLVQTLVRMHGGSVEARSDGPGQGSEFVVRLPIAQAASVSIGARETCVAEIEDDYSRCRVLVVDDNKDSANSLAMMLKVVGTETHVAYDGPSALEAFATRRPELVLMDLGMPGMDGYEVARRLREDPTNEDILLVALTGWGQEEDRRRSQEAGFNHHLVKPVDLSALRVVLASTASLAENKFLHIQ
jgi:PAS domain S-box-containing protein